ncbi:Lcl domain-containing protein [Vibrio gallaecicus]|uniref:Lcl domain-containing protein n=1 Tax=Vibrio gallaecicus TaxID=552386 RepID=UPI00338E01B7
MGHWKLGEDHLKWSSSPYANNNNNAWNVNFNNGNDNNNNKNNNKHVRLVRGGK